MRPQNAFKLSADSLQCRPRAQVASVGMKANPKHLPFFERVREHQELRFRVHWGSNGRASQPRVSDLTGIGERSSMPFVISRPSPPFHLEESRGPDHRPIGQTHRGKGHGASFVSPCKCSFHITSRRWYALGNGTPLIKRQLIRAGRSQGLHMPVLKRFQTNVPPAQDSIFHPHFSSMQF